MTYDLCKACLGDLPSYDHFDINDTVRVVHMDDCPRCAAESVTLTAAGRAITRKAVTA